MEEHLTGAEHLTDVEQLRHDLFYYILLHSFGTALIMAGFIVLLTSVCSGTFRRVLLYEALVLILGGLFTMCF